MKLLIEIPLGFALFDILDQELVSASKSNDMENLRKAFLTVESAQKVVKLIYFQRFADAEAAFQAATNRSSLCQELLDVIQKCPLCEEELLGLAGSEARKAILKKKTREFRSDEVTDELSRLVKNFLCELIPEISIEQVRKMSRDLSIKFCKRSIEQKKIQGKGKKRKVETSASSKPKIGRKETSASA